jgi:hypothetical protein
MFEQAGSELLPNWRGTLRDELSLREKVLAVLFTFSTLGVAVYLLGNEPKRPQFWICAALSIASLAASRQRLVLTGGLFAFATLRLALAVVLRPRWEAVVGLIICAAVTFMIVRAFPNDGLGR